VKRAEDERRVALILDRSSFYNESGGQVADIGFITGEACKHFETDRNLKVDDIQSCGPYVLHCGVVDGAFEVGDKITCSVDYENRNLTIPNHTMTHVLNQALRNTLGEEVDQKGSVVDPQKLRFDFNSDKLKVGQIKTIEEFVNKQIEQDLKIYELNVPYKKAVEVDALRCVFGNYPEIVRVIAVGVPVEEALKAPKDKKWFDYSIELCGGNHLESTGAAGKFVVISEEGPSEGTRRVVAYTGVEAQRAIDRASALEERIESCFNMKGAALTAELKLIKRMMETKSGDDAEEEEEAGGLPYLKRREFENKIKQLDKLDKKNKALYKAKALEKLEPIMKSPPNYLIHDLRIRTDSKALNDISKRFQKKCPQCSFVFYSTDADSKNQIILKAAGAKKSKVDAKAWLETIKVMINGGCGGKAASATGNGRDCSRVEEVRETLEKWAKENCS